MRAAVKHWLWSLGAAIIGGGAGAVTSTLTVTVIAPQSFSPWTHASNFLSLAGATFVINGLVSAFFYLKQAPLPPEPPET